jgi:prepilin-type N-terminal cleavage/methylation domain-containing protein
MIFSVLEIKQSNRRAAAFTMIEMMVTITIVLMLAALLLGAMGGKISGSRARVNYLQWRDDIVAAAKHFRWDYHKPGDAEGGRKIAELQFDPSVRDDDLHHLWELIQPHFIKRHNLNKLDFLNFRKSDFSDRWMTNIIGIDQTGYPYRLDGLQRLYLEETRISDNALKVLYQPVPYLQPSQGEIQADLNSSYAMTSLLEIDVYKCKKVTKQGIADLKKALPNVKVRSNWDPYAFQD